MIKLDLITGFLGAGKTTFIKKYVTYLLQLGERICIIENDFGAINVDMVILKELEKDGVNLEMVVGGDGKEAHKRRLKTKLISMAMMGYDRVIIEPSGIFDVDEFFDLLYEEPIDRFYEASNVIAIVDSKLQTEMSKQARYILMSEIADAGAIVFSRTQDTTKEKIEEVVQFIEAVMIEFKCSGKLDKKTLEYASWESTDTSWLARIVKSGFNRSAYEKMPLETEDSFQTIFYFDFAMDKEILLDKINHIFADEKCGDVHRIKGFVKASNGALYEINTTRNEKMTREVNATEAVLIVIGENLDKVQIAEYLGKPTI